MDAGTTAGAVLASTVRVGVRARVNGKGRSSTFSRGGAAICTNGAARNHRALPRCVGAGSSRGHVKHRLHVPATFQLWNGSPAASGGEGSCSGFATQACESLASEIRAERGRAELMNRRARQFAAASTGEASADALVSKGFGPPALLASGGDERPASPVVEGGLIRQWVFLVNMSLHPCFPAWGNGSGTTRSQHSTLS